MSVSTHCPSQSSEFCAAHPRLFLGPLVGAILALAVVGGAAGVLPLFAAENTHLPPERLAEIQRMMAAD